jgi:hypothetical protein
VKEGLIAIGTGSDSGEILEALLRGGPSCYGIDTLGEGPWLMVAIDQ